MENSRPRLYLAGGGACSTKYWKDSEIFYEFINFLIKSSYT